MMGIYKTYQSSCTMKEFCVSNDAPNLRQNVSGVKHLLPLLNTFYHNSVNFESTVHTTLPIRTASQGVSFAFKTFSNIPSMPINDAHPEGFSFYGIMKYPNLNVV